jgi:hypothetical protein
VQVFYFCPVLVPVTNPHLIQAVWVSDDTVLVDERPEISREGCVGWTFAVPGPPPIIVRDRATGRRLMTVEREDKAQGLRSASYAHDENCSRTCIVPVVFDGGSASVAWEGLSGWQQLQLLRLRGSEVAGSPSRIDLTVCVDKLDRTVIQWGRQTIVGVDLTKIPQIAGRCGTSVSPGNDEDQ